VRLSRVGLSLMGFSQLPLFLNWPPCTAAASSTGRLLHSCCFPNWLPCTSAAFSTGCLALPLLPQLAALLRRCFFNCLPCTAAASSTGRLVLPLLSFLAAFAMILLSFLAATAPGMLISHCLHRCLPPRYPAEGNYGTTRQRLGKDSLQEVDACCLTLQPCADPWLT